MPASGLPDPAPRDLDLVVQTLAAISPRWNAWVLMSLATPARYSDLKARMPWLADGQLYPKLRLLEADGLVQRTEHTRRHVVYGLTDQGVRLLPVLDAFAEWGQQHLERPTVTDPVTRKQTPRPVARAEEIEDALALVSPRHSTAILWTLRARGASTAAALASSVMPDAYPTSIYYPLRHLTMKGLVGRDRDGMFTLTAAGRALAPAYRALTAWATTRSATLAVTSRPAPVPTQTGPAPRSTGAALQVTPVVPAWKPGDLFSHTPVARRPLMPAAPAGGVRR
ncbi:MULTISPECIES: helix-turn-helix domain-containing protein [unclassified Streptomyces]|uniref:winged helix-turn-helix transcriptional regulator n=1 Tax=unclassified Streptomyces TaxID=2593676 RepID=UPI0029669438|nr:helix-turn-helix domain-containing protein [Streptomyces sp. SJL17-1]